MTTFEERYATAAREFLERAWQALSDGSYRTAAFAAEDAANTLAELAAVLTTRAAQERKEAAES